MNSEDEYEKEICDSKEISKLQQIVDEYNFNDLEKSIFCLNSFLGNRSHLTLIFRLNYTLIRHGHQGHKNIDSYDDFSKFCEKIFDCYDSKFDDPVSLDNGEIYFKYNNSFRKCILGNGYNRSYAFYNSIYNYGEQLKMIDELDIVLLNNDLLISLISKFNEKPEKYYHLTVYIPDEEYFTYIRNNFDNFRLKYTPTEFDKLNNRIIDTTAFKYKEEWHPVFNICGPISFVTQKLKVLSKKDYQYLARLNLVNTVFDLFDGNFNHFILGGSIVKDIKKSEIVQNQIFDLIITSGDKIILFKNNLEWSKKEQEVFEKELNKILSSGHVLIHSNLLNGGNVVEIKEIREALIFNLCPALHYEIDSSYINNNLKLIHYYDLIQILLLSKSVEEICDFFIKYNSLNINTVYFNTLTDFFIMYKNQNGHIEAGALKFGSYLFDIYQVECYFLESFNNFNKWFSFSNNPILMNPFSWNFLNENNNIFEMSSKTYHDSIINLIAKSNEKNVIFSFNPKTGGTYDINVMTNIGLLRDLITNYLSYFANVFSKMINYEMSFLYMSEEYTKKLKGCAILEQKHKYVFSDCILNQGHILVRYTVDFEKFKSDHINCKNNLVEVTFWSELFECLSLNGFCSKRDLDKSLDVLENKKKEIALFNFTPNFYYSEKPSSYFISEELKADVNKKISIIAKRVGFDETEYFRKDFRNKVREFQKIALKDFEDEISLFSKYDLHSKLVSILASIYIDRSMVGHKKESLSRDELSAKCFQTVNKNLLEEENKNKFVVRSLLYLIDTNLAVNHLGTKVANSDDVNMFICLSNTLVGLQDDSDIANYGIEPIKLKVEYDYRITPVYDDSTIEKITNKSKRIINSRAYLPCLKTNYKEHLKNAMDCFYKDTHINFIDMKNILTFLSDGIGYKEFEVEPNVIKINKQKLMDDIKASYSKNGLQITGVDDALDFLIINETCIKKQNGNSEHFVPIWNREGRDNRFEIKPLVFSENSIYFCPVQCNWINKMWSDSMFQFFLPYEFGLEKTREYLIEKWKPECEMIMESDIRDMLRNAKMKAESSLFLHSRFPKREYPSDLGDFDVLAIDEENKLILNIETKYLVFQGSIKEYFNFQDWFFNGKNRRDKVFKKRIEFLKHHTEKIINDVFKIFNVSEYKIINLMVTNKVLTCDIGNVDFKIISYSELEDMVSSGCCDEQVATK